ncbi:MAG: adenylate/guanylate cyclase domain-containing protein [Gammaproteobacteria bacterium]
MARLVVTGPTAQTQNFELERQDIRIGRGMDCDLVLADSLVSRHHASIVHQNGGYVITDLNSANGLFVNDARTTSRAIVDGDTIAIGRHLLRFENPVASGAIAFSEKMPRGTFLFKPATELFTPAKIEGQVPSIPSLSPSLEGELAQLRKKSRILTLLYDLGKTLGSVFSLEDIYRKVASVLYEDCPYYRMVILLADEATGNLRPVFIHRGGAEAASSPLEQVKVSSTVTRRVIEERVALLSLDARQDPSLAQAKSILVEQLQSVMCAPLLGNSGVAGVIYLDQKAVGAFTPDDLDFLNAVAAQSGIAVENALTHERLTRAAEARAVYQRFMPAAIVEQILANPDSIQLGGVNQTVTVLFADIRGFTSLSEIIEPDEVVSMLNSYFSEMVEIIFQHGGTIDKFMGDGLMALFGAPYTSPQDAANAVRTGIEMQRRLNVIRDTFVRKDGSRLDVHIGIGINTGNVVVGYIGSQRRTDYTAIGDTVNLAARLEHEAGRGELIISESTYNLVLTEFSCEPVGSREIRGKRDSVACYRVAWQGDKQESTRIGT